MKYYLGIDNGVTGSYAWLSEKGQVLDFAPTPVFSALSYNKTKVKHRTRIDYKKWHERMEATLHAIHLFPENLVKALIERPMINPMRFQATVSASASLEATLILLESFDIPYEYIDSKQWQKALLPHGIQKEELKEASVSIGRRLFPQEYNNHIDCDALLIAEFARRTNL